MSKLLENHGFLKVAAIIPSLRVADIDYNTKQIINLAGRAAKAGARLIVFPELSLTAYTLGDLFHQQVIQNQTRDALRRIKERSKELPSVLVVGLPLAVHGKLFNVAAVIFKGKIYGFVPKTYIPNYNEFYEKRWFASSRDLRVKEINFGGETMPIGTDLLFRFTGLDDAVLGIEICEDLWMPIPPSSFQFLEGATIIANLSASNELVGKADYRRNLIAQQSARGVAGYIYVSCGVSESTTDVVFGGHAVIGENGSLLAESNRFNRQGEIVISELDLEHLASDRKEMTNYAELIDQAQRKTFRFIDVPLTAQPVAQLSRRIDPRPFIPGNPNERDKRAEEIFNIQTAGLAKRMEQSGFNKLLIGVSGGLDSTLALLVAVKTCDLLKIPLKNIHAFTMPGFATTKRTKSNALTLAKALGASVEIIDITKGAKQHLAEINHNNKEQDVVFQNAQARYRTMILMNKANQLHGLVVGTGDLSEIALGWSTFTGDHISHYNVNASVPKTLIKHLVEWVSEQNNLSKVKKILRDIIATPISPELVRAGKDSISQKTEELIGPYELHDFFLYHFIRWGSAPKKILFLANQAFGGKYSPTEIKKWLKLFITRFFNNQWKRSVMPDGPKVGSIALSPRGDWRMPSDAEVSLWLKDLNS